MAPQHERTPELRRFLVINFRVGSRENGYLVGPALVSTRDYKWFHLWDEPSAAVLGEDDYEVVKVYRLGLTYDEVTRQFANDFPSVTTGPYRSAGWIALDGTFYAAQGWADLGQHLILQRRVTHVFAFPATGVPDRTARRPTNMGMVS